VTSAAEFTPALFVNTAILPNGKFMRSFRWFNTETLLSFRQFIFGFCPICEKEGGFEIQWLFFCAYTPSMDDD